MRKIVAIALGVALALTATVALAGRNSSGTMSMAAVAGGYPYVSGQTISSSGVNANMAELVTELTDSLSRSGKGGMTAPLRGSDGSASLPAFSWTSDTNTGFYRIGADDVGLSTGGTLRLRQSSTGLTETGWVQVSGSITVTDGTNRTEVYPNGEVEMISSAAYIDFKSDPASDFDTRIYKATGGHLQINGTPLEVSAPVDANDAANKQYVDDAIQLIATTDAWHNVGAGGEPAITSPWTIDGAPSAVLRFRKVAGVVYVQGSISSGGNNADVFALPTGYRPNGDLYIVDGDTGLGGPGLTKVTASTGMLRTVGGASTRRSYNFSFPAD